MRLLPWPRKKTQAAPVTIPVPDLWEGVAGNYIAMYRDKLEKIARTLAEVTKRSVKTLFNRELKCVEFVDEKNGEVLVHVRVHGSEGSPYETLVDTDLGAIAEGLFVGMLPKVRFEKFAVA